MPFRFSAPAVDQAWFYVAYTGSLFRCTHTPKYSLRADLEGETPHVLRHTFATRYLEANPDDLRGLAKLLGHANLNTVIVYTEPALEDLAARMEKVEIGL